MLKRSLLPTLLLTTFAVCNSSYAVYQVGGLVGIANYTTKIKGDSIYSYGSYYSYPMDINSKVPALGVNFGRVMPYNNLYDIGFNVGYTFIYRDVKRLRSDTYVQATRVSAEKFYSKSLGFIYTNLIGRFNIVPNIKVNVFAGPTLLHSKYIAHDNIFGSTFKKETLHLTANIGIEPEWQYSKDLAFGLRFEHIFQSTSKVVARRGNIGTPLISKTKANSGLTMFSVTAKYNLSDSFFKKWFNN